MISMIPPIVWSSCAPAHICPKRTIRQLDSNQFGSWGKLWSWCHWKRINTFRVYMTSSTRPQRPLVWQEGSSKRLSIICSLRAHSQINQWPWSSYLFHRFHFPVLLCPWQLAVISHASMHWHKGSHTSQLHPWAQWCHPWQWQKLHPNCNQSPPLWLVHHQFCNICFPDYGLLNPWRIGCELPPHPENHGPCMQAS